MTETIKFQFFHELTPSDVHNLSLSPEARGKFIEALIKSFSDYSTDDQLYEAGSGMSKQTLDVLDAILELQRARWARKSR